MRIFKTHIKEYRAKFDMTQDDLAKTVGVRRETIGNLENGRYNPSLKLAMDISKVFGCTVEDIFEIVNNENSCGK
ncbi:helix-turn-helix transcriptional regulator [Planococcus sp. CP5-4]|uniref:helix-turn-helix transcriptional regulator n=1 Tax=unclassified Planococcus (in: firmicutes) TaxID=2662419 RepID=UPI001C2142E7|nr:MULTISPECIES: helix-turn-helix transcriptional regulator [unclassified Planococcus (in: firmicutes)]MBU9674719.1 helix-turn-helix transcriptional regulator [Planococcus sp. CP5-4_YE]MBV0910360.1 helix-turn-helix transcriptional regulator [Planococcus sp. CP5-4_UN]MBW6063864.1 helix-turn-helix transcriptional regulator [Planococcus sp. CP5-4]